MADPVTLYHYKNGNLHTHNGVAASLHEGCQLVGEFIPVEESIIQELSRVRDQRDDARLRLAKLEVLAKQLANRWRDEADAKDGRAALSRMICAADLDALLEGDDHE